MLPKILKLSACIAIFAAFQILGADKRPNIIFIMADDHAAHAISAYGSKVNKTPNIDRIAKEGMRFDSCFCVNSICTPSRASILTGKYSHKNGVPVFNTFDGAQPTFVKYLHAAGYYTGMIGKWHLGSKPEGFDYWIVLPGQGAYNNPVFLTPEGRKTFNGYVTDIITDLTLDFLKNRPKDKPFLLLCHHKAPHRTWIPSDKYREEFSKKVIPEPPTLWDDYSTRADPIRNCAQKISTNITRMDLKLTPPPNLTPEERRKWIWESPTSVEIEENGVKKVLTGKELVAWKYQRYMQDYLACVQSVDDSVGKVLDYLDKEGLSQNTIVIYTSDQGFFLGDHGLYDKRFMYEESLRMPFLIRWTAAIKPGTVEKSIILNVDFAPTFLDICGLNIPSDIQGRSFLPLLKGEHPSDWRKSFYYRYYHDPGDHNTAAHYGVRTETHKLIYYWKINQWECFDLVNDPLELKNIYNDPDKKEIVNKLKEELYRLKKEVQDNDEFADKLPPSGVDGMNFAQPVKEAIRSAK
jgi:arylsulfatase A-like enzyme